MSDLSPDAVAHLWPVLQLLAAVGGALVTILGVAWAGFRWLRTQIRETAEELLRPVTERVAVVERTAEAAHRRIDEIVGKRL